MCGEQLSAAVTFMVRVGSPPRVRGTATHTQTAGKSRRITPACAGNSAQRPLFFISGKDHPRVCGEQFMLLSLQKAVVGSPPRVRGTASKKQPGGGAAGITPACAGNSRGGEEIREKE